jgi:hypothetical protein
MITPVERNSDESSRWPLTSAYGAGAQIGKPSGEETPAQTMLARALRFLDMPVVSSCRIQ